MKNQKSILYFQPDRETIIYKAVRDISKKVI